MKNTLLDREKQILEYMKKELRTKGYPPTVRELCQSLGIKSTSTVHKDIYNLEQKGYIRKDPAKPRAIEILNMDYPAYYPTPEERLSAPSLVSRDDIADIPMVGRIAAGQPILADQNIEDTFPVPTQFMGKGNHFMLTVNGDSMIDAGIFDGDYILVQEQNTAENGSIVVAAIENYDLEATVKTYYKEKDHIRLQPENPHMQPIIVKDAKILGIVKGVFRKM
ncbi:MAG: transcriptional repressor LexA [Peptostreptococcales bacterium]